MAFTQADLDAVNALIASGVSGGESRFQDRMIRYGDLFKVKAEIENDLAKQGSAPIVRQIRPVVNSGW